MNEFFANASEWVATPGFITPAASLFVIAMWVVVVRPWVQRRLAAHELDDTGPRRWAQRPLAWAQRPLPWALGLLALSTVAQAEPAAPSQPPAAPAPTSLATGETPPAPTTPTTTPNPPATGGPVAPDTTAAETPARPATATAVPTTTPTAAEPPAAESPIEREAAAIGRTTQAIRDLSAGVLDVSIDPASLFEVPLDDEPAIQLERERLRAVLECAQDPSAPVTEPAPPKKSRRKQKPTPPPEAEAKTPIDPTLFTARAELDRERLAFYSLPKARRAELLQAHAQRQRAAQEAADSALSKAREEARQAAEAQRLAQLAAEQEQQQALVSVQQAQAQAEEAQRLALEAVRQARTEAERAVAEERARLLGVASDQAAFEAQLIKSRQVLKDRAETTLSFRRRVREAADMQSPAAADALYDELRSFLKASRDELAASISTQHADSQVPDPGPDRLSELSVDIDRTVVDQSLAEIREKIVRLAAEEQQLRRDRVAQLYDEVRALNSDRLSLLTELSPSKRAAITGFGGAGFDQALSELRQVTLLLRYHGMAARRWVAGLGDSGTKAGMSAMTAGFVVVKWAFAVFILSWWRRRGGTILAQWRQRVREEDRRSRAVEPSRLHAVLQFIERTRNPLEWLLFGWALILFLPPEVRSQLEVSLVITIFVWALSGSLAVSVIDALASGDEFGHTKPTAQIRLRSLRLMGRTIVAFGLILALSDKLVGKGTIYRWVFSVCWFAAIPVALVLVRWWREIIFKRIEGSRKHKAFAQWVLANRSGWKSFAAAVAAGAYLLGYGTFRAVRAWVGRFDMTRRALAYFFRRGLDRIAEQKLHLAFGDLPPEIFASLGPETPSHETIPGGSADQVAGVVDRINRAGGGVFAVVGERGAGKTTVLEQVRTTLPDVVVVDCPPTGLEDLHRALIDTLSLAPDASLEACAAAANAPDRDPALLIDNAHRLIQPVMGGLNDFDRLISVARGNSSTCTWFFAVDEVIWRFLERARGARPLFDDVIRLEPWREEEIAGLLQLRDTRANLDPSFEHLVERLPADADDTDRAEGLARASAGYYRLIWDYSAGNPGVALHMWRRSLGVDPTGKVCVKLFQAPDARELEQLPDPAVFVLRAVIQLDPALPDDVARATMLRGPQVEDALRYGMARGYFACDGERYRVTWAWFRPITRFLQRRHLLAAPR